MSTPDDAKLTRDQALAARPLAVEVQSRKPLPDGGVKLTVHVPSGRFSRTILRLPPTLPRQFELDAVGVAILDQCDGKHTVKHLIKTFATEHHVDPAEAERAVTAFLRMLIQRGLVSMVVRK